VVVVSPTASFASRACVRASVIRCIESGGAGRETEHVVREEPCAGVAMREFEMWLAVVMVA
jgi:hypothetical protein